jgi:DNA-binding beta-propeller fold protein YncE
LRFLLRLDTTSNVVFFDGEKFRTVVDGLRLADGINQSVDGKRIYVTEGFGQSLTTYDRDPQTNNLNFVSKTMLPGAPDNVSVSPDGEVFVAVFPNMLETLKYLVSGGQTARPSSEVLELAPVGNAFEIKPAWADDGGRITLVTTGAPYSKAANGYSLLMSTISPRDDYVLACVPTDSAAEVH